MLSLYSELVFFIVLASFSSSSSILQLSWWLYSRLSDCSLEYSLRFSLLEGEPQLRVNFRLGEQFSLLDQFYCLFCSMPSLFFLCSDLGFYLVGVVAYISVLSASPSSKNCRQILNYYWKYLRYRFYMDSFMILSLDRILPQCSSSPFLGVPSGLYPLRSSMEGQAISQFSSFPTSSLLSYYFSSSTDSSPARLMRVLLFLSAGSAASSLNTSISHYNLGQLRQTSLYLPLGHRANHSSRQSSPGSRGGVSCSRSSTAKMYRRGRASVEAGGDDSAGILSSTAGLLAGG